MKTPEKMMIKTRGQSLMEVFAAIGVALAVVFGAVGLLIAILPEPPENKAEAISVPLIPATKLETPENTTNLICESIELNAHNTNAKEVQDQIISWQKQHPKAKISSILGLPYGNTGIRAIVITAYEEGE